jgi:hypothetical protein
MASVGFLLLALAGIASAQAPPRPWDLSIRLFTEYDSNIPVAARSTDFTGHKEGVDLGAGVSGSYKFIQERQWDLGAGGNIVQVWNTRSGLSDFNLTSLSPRLFGDYFFEAWTKPAQAEMAYQFRSDWLGGSGFEKSHTISWDFGIMPSRNLLTGIYYHLAVENFDDEGDTPSLTSRDAVNHTLGIKGTYSYGYNRPSITLNYQFSHNDADGRNFTFDSHGISARFITPIIIPVKMILDAGYTSQDYTHFTPRPERTQDNQNYGITFLLPVSRNLTADLGYKFAKYKGSESRFEAKKHKVGLGLAYDFR